MIHVAQLIKNYFNGSVANYLDNSSTVFSSIAMNAISKLEFSDTELQILRCVNRNSGIKLSDLLELLRDSLSSSKVIETLGALQEKTFLEKTKNGLVVSPLIRKHLSLGENLGTC